MAVVELASASPLDNRPLQSMRVVMGSTPVLTSTLETSPSTSYRRSKHRLCLYPYDVWVQLITGPSRQPLGCSKLSTHSDFGF